MVFLHDQSLHNRRGKYRVSSICMVVCNVTKNLFFLVTDSRSEVDNISSFLWITCLPLNIFKPLLYQMKTLRSHTFYFFNIFFNIILRCTAKSRNWLTYSISLLSTQDSSVLFKHIIFHFYRFNRTRMYVFHKEHHC
jgi:hypothetical protein